MKKLNDQEEAFKLAYLKTLNPYEAAIEAQYAESTAKSKAFTWVSDGKCPENKIHLYNAIQEAKKERRERNQVDADYVLRRLVEIDELDVLDIVSDDLSDFKALSDWPKAWRQSISGIDLHKIISKGRNGEDDDFETLVKKIKWPDKTKNLELLGKHINVQAFKENINNTGEVKHNVMLVPSCTDTSDWEQQAQEQQSDLLK